MTERNLDISIELINNCMFRVEIYDPESGDHARASFDDSDVAELKSFLADEILGWVNIMRDDEEAQIAEKFARHEHEKAMSKETARSRDKMRIYENERGFIEENKTDGFIRIMVCSPRNLDGMIAHDYNETLINYHSGLCQTWGACGYRVSYLKQLKGRENAIAYGKNLLVR